MGLGTPDTAALIVRIVRGWANDMAMAPKEGQDADVVLPTDLENAYGRAFRSTCMEAARSACPQLAAICAAPCKLCWPRQITRIDLHDDMNFLGSAAELNRTWNSIEDALAGADHRLRGYRCGVWAPGFEQFEDAELPMEVRNRCLKVPRKRHVVNFLRSANAQHCNACRPGPTC